jgi:hypothetical protein
MKCYVQCQFVTSPIRAIGPIQPGRGANCIRLSPRFGLLG